MKSTSTSKKHRSPSRSSKPSTSSSFLKACAFGVGISLITAIALALICTIICTVSGDSDKLLAPLAFGSTVIAYFAGGFAASRKKSGALAVGALCGGILSAIFILVSLCLGDSLSSGMALPVSLLIRLSFILVSILGSLVGTNLKISHKRRR